MSTCQYCLYKYVPQNWSMKRNWLVFNHSGYWLLTWSICLCTQYVSVNQLLPQSCLHVIVEIDRSPNVNNTDLLNSVSAVRHKTMPTACSVNSGSSCAVFPGSPVECCIKSVFKAFVWIPGAGFCSSYHHVLPSYQAAACSVILGFSLRHYPKGLAG